MADAVTKVVVAESQDLIKVHLTNISDATGEAAVTKIDKSTLKAGDGSEPASLDLVSARWAIQGFTCVEILWDHTTDDVGMVLSGNGSEDFEAEDPRWGKQGRTPLPDPRSSGGTGDVLLTTVGAAAGATYDITLTFRKNRN